MIFLKMKGFADANNIGIRYCIEKGCDYMLLLNNDTIVNEGFIEPLVDFYENSNKNIGALTGKVYYFDYPDVFWWGGDKHNIRFRPMSWMLKHNKDIGQYERILSTRFITGCYIQ